MFDEGVIALVPQLFYNHSVEGFVSSEKKKKIKEKKKRRNASPSISRLGDLESIKL